MLITLWYNSSMNKVKTLFIGSSDFGIPSLEFLMNSDYIELVGIVTQPDKPVGRKQVLTPTEIKTYAQSKGFDSDRIIAPVKLRLESKDILVKFKPELIIVAAYGQIIPDDILEYPKHKCLNIHGSFLPLLRGAVPVQMAVLQGFKETGVTIQRMVSEMDKGPVIARSRGLEVEGKTAGELMNELSLVAKETLSENLENWILGELEEVSQDDSNATYCYKTDISKDKAEIKFETDINLAERMIRAFNPWPIAWIKLQNDKVFKIYGAQKPEIRDQGSDVPNLKSPISNLQLFKQNKKLYLQLSNGVLELLEVQMEGKKKGSGHEYLWLASQPE